MHGKASPMSNYKELRWEYPVQWQRHKVLEFLNRIIRRRDIANVCITISMSIAESLRQELIKL